MSHTAHPAAFELVKRPVILAADHLQWHGETVEILEDQGDMVTIKNRRNTKPLKGGGRIAFEISIAQAPKGLLVAENMQTFLKVTGRPRGECRELCLGASA
jgi:hypothetical protein